MNHALKQNLTVSFITQGVEGGICHVSGGKFLRLYYSDITNNTYNRRRTITETLKKFGLFANARHSFIQYSV